MFNLPKKYYLWLTLLVFSSAIGSTLHFHGFQLETSVIPTKQPEPFNGTALPLLNVPNWVALTKDEWKLPYDQIPDSKKIPLPNYNLEQLTKSLNSVGWTKESDKALRNAKIIFSTPYMWKYSGEDGGSHLAIDIKTSDFTPVYAIGNGIVTKVSTQSSGFGQHIVVKHENFPSFEDPSKKVTYYSSYNHLGKILIGEGEVVAKGQKIALSGHSGTATTPHLHFQIDTEKAPWHPYWPFTYQEASAAGYDFGEAVNAGLGRDKALVTTIDPMLYVQKYLDGTTLPASSGTVPALDPPPAVSSVTPAPPAPATLPPTAPSEPVTPASEVSESVFPSTPALPAVRFRFSVDGNFSHGNGKKLMLQAIDENGDIATSYKPKDGVAVTLELGGATIPKNYFQEKDFSNGTAVVEFIPTVGPSLRFKAFDGEISGISDIIQGNVFSDVAGDQELEIALAFLKEHKILNGYPDGSFRPNQAVTRVEALKTIYEAHRPASAVQTPVIQTRDLPFKDVVPGQWYTLYVYKALQSKVVNGYPDKTFKPQKIVVRSEFLKMLFLAMDLEPQVASTASSFEDVPVGSWFASYVAYAVDKNLMDVEGKNFGSGLELTRGEMAKLIYRLLVLQLSGQTKYAPDLAISDSKIREYFGG